MMRFLTKNTASQNEKEKVSRLKQQCKFAVEALLQLHKQHQTHHCVLVIGQPESGKSILCASLGKLLLSTQTNLSQPQKNSNEFSFEIYLHRDTLFFHIPQDFFLFSETLTQQRLWYFIASQLRKHNAYLPITHCVVCIDLHDFLTRNKISNETRLTQTALALNAFTAGFKNPLDITLFFTKADLMPGFAEFFEHESKEFLEQSWGISLDESDAAALATECDNLIKKLNERLIWSLHHEIHVENLYLIKTFPLMLETVKQKFSDILPGFLNQWDESRHLNATELYFVSCRQFKELTEVAHSDNALTKVQPQQNNHKVFFAKQALENHCHHQATDTNTTIEKTTRFIFIILCGLLFIAFVFYNSQQFSRHIKLIHTVNKTVESGLLFAKTPYSILKLNNVTHELDEISSAWEALDKNQRSSFIENAIFTKDSKLEVQLQNIYQRIVSQQWLPLITQQLENYINANLASHPANAYIAFNMYLMLSQTDWPIDTHYIQMHLGDLLGHENDPAKLLSNNIQKNILVEDENSPFIQKVQASFAALPTNKLAYVLFFASIDSHHPLALASALNAEQPSLDLDSTFANISEIYTANAFPDIYKKRLPQIVAEAIHGNNVLGTYHHDDISENDLLNQLQEEYVKLYSDSWEQAIQHTNLSPISTLAELATQLKILTSVNSPILNLLNLSQTNTSMAQIEQSSAFLNAFNQTLTKQSTPENNALYRSFALLIKLQDQILAVENNNDQQAAACRLLVNENASTPQNPTEAKQISLLATQLPPPMQTWMQQLIDSYYTLLNQQAGNCQ